MQNMTSGYNMHNNMLYMFNMQNHMNENMQDKNGGFYFRKFKNHLEKYSFMRWSNSWMFVGLWSLIRDKKINSDA